MSIERSVAHAIGVSVGGQEDMSPTFSGAGDALCFAPPPAFWHWTLFVMHSTDYIGPYSFCLLACCYLLLDSVFSVCQTLHFLCQTVLFEELLILTVTPCIGVHCSNFHEIWSVNSQENY